MNETLEQLIRRELDERYHRRIVELGYWCGRCQCDAYPAKNPPRDQPVVGGDGWCPMCGMNPLIIGPPYHPPGSLGGINHNLRGILG